MKMRIRTRRRIIGMEELENAEEKALVPSALVKMLCT
jgi:hypothetical protein